MQHLAFSLSLSYSQFVASVCQFCSLPISSLHSIEPTSEHKSVSFLSPRCVVKEGREDIRYSQWTGRRDERRRNNSCAHIKHMNRHDDYNLSTWSSSSSLYHHRSPLGIFILEGPLLSLRFFDRDKLPLLKQVLKFSSKWRRWRRKRRISIMYRSTNSQASYVHLSPFSYMICFSLIFSPSIVC